MINNPRRMWTSLLFIVLFAPFVVLLVISFLAPGGKTTGSLAMTPIRAAAEGTPAGGAATPGSAVTLAGGNRANAPLLAAGDGHDLWVARPRIDENKTAGFELLRRTANSGVWRIASNNGLQTFCTRLGLPQGLALRLPHGGGAGSSPYIFGENGYVYQFSLNNFDNPGESLPASDILKAAAGGQDQLFVVTLGRGWPDLHPGDRLPNGKAAATSSASGTAPSATAPSATTPASQPATSVATGAAPGVFNVYWYPVSQATPAPSTLPTTASRPDSGYWSLLPPLVDAARNPARVPLPSSFIALAESQGRLIVLWVDPMRQRSIMARTLDYGSKNAQWSEPIETLLPQDDAVPFVSRLFTVSLDGSLYVLWTRPTGESMELHGGWMNTDPSPAVRESYRLNHRILPMSLGLVGQGINENDVAVGASENSIVAVALSRDGVLQSAVFDKQGREILAAAPVVPQSMRRDVQIGQNITMVLVVLMLTLSLWQWRQKPPTVTLPKGFAIAPLHLRGGAFFLDLLIPYIVVLILFSGWDGGPFAMGEGWLDLPSHPDELARAWNLFTFLALYFVHVVVGELFFRRSLGKALVGIEVRMLDGKSPTVGAVLVRNLVRIPECAVGIVLLYLVVSERRQRLGDLLAKTMVVGQESPETPEDPDKKKS